ncbi:uncharacterized protein HaLaN_22531, partial [Haematococcus lacustris]
GRGAAQGPVLLTNCTFVGNTATSGGAVHVHQSCNTTLDATCGTAAIAGPAQLFRENQAIGGGGGALWMYEADDVVLGCGANTSLTLPAHFPLISSCPEWAASNNATWGPLIATTATAMLFNTPASGRVNDYLS